jgi:hypothetical protein
MAEAAVATGFDLLDRCSNFFGSLSTEVRYRLMACIADPSPDTWDAAYSIILNANVGLGRTLWQAVIGVDPSCPRIGAPEGRKPLTPTQRWGGYSPTPWVVLAAVEYANQGR